MRDLKDLRSAPASAPGQVGRAAGQTGRLDAQARLLDPATVEHIKRLGLLSGWRCASVGAGGGAIATWLAQRLAATGHVVAVEGDLMALDGLRRSACAGLEVRKHDIVLGPLEPAAYDLVYTRLLLARLPERARAVEHMVASLRPGGWLLAEDYDMGTGGLELAGLKGVQVEVRRVGGGLLVAAWGRKLTAPFV